MGKKQLDALDMHIIYNTYRAGAIPRPGGMPAVRLAVMWVIVLTRGRQV
jgi:hypothetical protein